MLDRIQRLDGFSRFLLPPLFDDLQQAAESGPVIIVNASEYTCDALIVLYTRPPVRVDLDCPLEHVAQLCSQFSELIQDPHAYGQHRELWVKQSLRNLWAIAVEPIVNALQDDVQLPLGSRLWWCPASKLTTLLLHAARPYRKDQKNLIDLYVSSYAPSFSSRSCACACLDLEECPRICECVFVCSRRSGAARWRPKPARTTRSRARNPQDSE